MLARWFRPDAAELACLVEYVGSALIERAAAVDLWATPDLAVRLTAIRRGISNAYANWWLALPWWKALWLTGSAERRFRMFTEHAQHCGLFDKWLKRMIIGISAVGPVDPSHLPIRGV